MSSGNALDDQTDRCRPDALKGSQVKHADSDALNKLEPLLRRMRELPGLTEKKRGIFYLKSRAFLHFHEDPRGLFADVRAENGSDFERLEVSDPRSHEGLLQLALARLGDQSSPRFS